MAKQVISFHYTLTDKNGKKIDSSVGNTPVMFLEGIGQIIPGLEKILVVLDKGDKKIVTVPYPEAYGAYDQTLISQVPREQFPVKEVQVGDMFKVGKAEDYRVVTVIEVKDAEVVLDGNHPLAGQDLTFAVEIMERRDATAEEMTHGHAHGPHGHSHDH